MLALLTLAAGTLCACAPTPAPSPTPTAAFATEAEAFAAAEEVYRAYNDAVNGQRQELSSEDPQEYLTGLALESDIDANRILEQNGIRIEGDGEVSSFRGKFTGVGTLTADICLDVSETRVIDANGLDVTPPGRPTAVALEVEFVTASKEVRISSSLENADAEC